MGAFQMRNLCRDCRLSGDDCTMDPVGVVNACQDYVAPELLACPFCGSEPVLIEFDLPHGHYYSVRCNCDVMTHDCRHKESCGQGWLDRDKAIAAWNERY